MHVAHAVVASCRLKDLSRPTSVVSDQTTSLRRLTKRAEFLRAARGSRTSRRGMSLQSAPVEQAEPGIGFTVTKRSGNSPQRNRIKRRLRAASRACQSGFRSQHDYVLIGRDELLSAPFTQIVSNLSKMLDKIHIKQPRGER